MFTPYDWQEGIGNRAQYIESKLAQGAPALALSVKEGIVVLSFKRQSQKIFEIYDKLIFAGIGQQSDVEALRMAAVDFAHQEGYNRSEQDVTIQRLVTAMSSPVKKAFGDFSASPLVARCLLAIGASPEEDIYYTMDFDGDYSQQQGSANIAGTDESATALKDALAGLKSSLSAEKAAAALKDIWLKEAARQELDASEMQPEAILLERNSGRENPFRTMII